MRQPHERQILVNLGNRYVVFGSGVNLPDQLQLGPKDVKEIYPRVGNERDGIERRIVDSLVVDGFRVAATAESEFGDMKIIDGDGRSSMIEIRVGDRDFAGLNLGQAWTELAEAADKGERREIWGFNLERLGLGIVWSDGAMAPNFLQFPALNVWSFNDDGTTFDRRDVLDHLKDWSHRLEAVFSNVEAWAVEDGLEVSRTRTIPMSEELMREFAVPDFDLPILDVAAGSTPVASLVPVGLWLMLFNGQIDIITKDGTFKLGDRTGFRVPAEWTLIDPRDRSQKPWKHEAFRSLLGLVAAHE